MSCKQSIAALAVLASLCSAAKVQGGKCTDTQWSTFCPKICTDGLGRKGWDYAPCANMFVGTCWTHSIQTQKSNSWQMQGAYMQKCMQEYCARGECGASHPSLLAKSRQEIDAGEKKWWNMPKNYFRAPKGNNWPKHYCANKTYYCAEICHNLYHPVMSDIGQHPGTQGCSMYSCETQEQCNRDCHKNWETGMKPVFDSYCKCEKEIGAGSYPQNLLEEAAQQLKQPKVHAPAAPEVEAVDVGAFIQTSMTGTADEL